MDMASAPKDGTRILIKHYTWGLNFKLYQQERTGKAITECWWDGERWQVWCGNHRTTSTAHIEALAWAEIPPELLGD